MLQAMNTGHDGSITTVHSNSPRDTLSRIETMSLMAGMDLPVRVIREQMASALDLVVHQARLPGGGRRVVAVAEVVRVAAGPATRELYGWRGDRPVWRAALGGESPHNPSTRASVDTTEFGAASRIASTSC